ncbi:MAG: hypothetical protein DMF59_13155 [Acidobacteria bacterium]|nr:MAG: hypothetical protein DMF59_13155 [Acidobacteriota bacterium]
MNPLLLLHICSAIVGLLSGFMAMALPKGSGLHGAAGSVFFVSMLGMGGAGAYIAAFIKPNNGNVMGGCLAIYLVSTAWMAARRRERKTGIFDFCALLLGLAIGAAGATWGVQAASSHTGLKNGYPAGLYFVFASIALLFAASDVRMLVRGGVFGAQRIARHLWRMCLTLLLATLSFYPGQARLFPKWLRETNLLYVPAVLLVGAMLLALYRVSLRKRAERDKPVLAANAILERAA